MGDLQHMVMVHRVHCLRYHLHIRNMRLYYYTQPFTTRAWALIRSLTVSGCIPDREEAVLARWYDEAMCNCRRHSRCDWTRRPGSTSCCAPTADHHHQSAESSLIISQAHIKSNKRRYTNRINRLLSKSSTIAAVCVNLRVKMVQLVTCCHKWPATTNWSVDKVFTIARESMTNRSYHVTHLATRPPYHALNLDGLGRDCCCRRTPVAPRSISWSISLLRVMPKFPRLPLQ